MAGAGRTKLSQLLRTRAASFLPTASRGYSAAGQDDVVKQAFVTQQTKFRAFLGELAKVKITLDSDDQKAVKEYATTMKSIRTKLAIPSYTEKIADLLDSAGDDATDVRSYLETQTRLRSEVGIQDDLGADKLTMQALDKVEKSLGKPLLLDDKQGLTLLSKEIDEINKKLGLDEALLEKLEEEVEMAVAKGELEEITKEAREKIETYKRRDELDTLVVDPKELDYRQYL
ncbi:hypothetical protein MPTK1_1g10430 [Marchantia polymorpha subsp. ruderalis]|uniref:Uncharacterized protein n=2 Tax=Marchantia polymorpha TaxID=3197 RepID=A0AAF6ANN1_MARPO|nr:hypothetical protein MARPO_0014s0184 [Marchantia polymorpha]BBM98051.1 hypothetical protein Mp_1g10430 [Marchantia polymorpha subsp. ruderalis]|eukprot:PTQ45675.1 hypothetical protein MARPO_0014s0184 [Marchantia polymorpha]